MLNIGSKEIIIMAVVVVLLFGGRKLPELTKGIADSIRHIRGAFEDQPAGEEEKKK